MLTVSLYSGAGGLDAGFIEAGFRIRWANDIDPEAVATYRQSLGDHITQGDLVGQVLPEPDSVEAVIGGPPCQGFSVAGKMDPHDPRSRHVWNFLGVVRRLQPRLFVMENVKALAVNERWAGLRDRLVDEAEGLGFTTRLFLLNAADFEVPQARERMFLVGMRGIVPTSPLPVSAGQPFTVGYTLKRMPAVGEPGNATRCAARITLAKQPVLRRSPYAGMLFNGQGRPLDPSKPAATLPASMGGNRTPIIDEELLRDGTKTSWVVQYHSKLWAGGRPGGKAPETLRRITVEEAAALQTFPGDFVFHGPQSAQYRQIGNAVPPRLAFHVARSIASQLGVAGDAEPRAA